MSEERRNEKLIGKKVAAARAGRPERTLPSPRDPRLPPGQHEAKVWPVLDLGIKPTIRLDEFQLAVDGAVCRPSTMSWPDLLAMPQATRVVDFHCVTTWSVFAQSLGGVLLRDVIDRAGPLPSARFVLFESSDGYTTNLPLAACQDDDVLVVHTWNGAPLPPEHGGPVRVVVPKRYGWKSAKWIRAIRLLETDQKGFWEVRGYSNTAFPWDEDRFA